MVASYPSWTWSRYNVAALDSSGYCVDFGDLNLPPWLDAISD